MHHENHFPTLDANDGLALGEVFCIPVTIPVTIPVEENDLDKGEGELARLGF